MRPHQADTEVADPIGEVTEQYNEDVIQKPLPPVAELVPPHEETPRISPAIRLLRWIELIGLESDYKQFRKQEATDDWYYLDGNEGVGPFTFTELLIMVRDGTPLTVIHESKVLEAGAEWSDITYKPVWTRPSVALWWTIGFWVFALSAGFMVVQMLLPAGIRGIAAIAYWLAAAAIAFQKNKHHFLKRSHMPS